MSLRKMLVPMTLVFCTGCLICTGCLFCTGGGRVGCWTTAVTALDGVRVRRQNRERSAGRRWPTGVSTATGCSQDLVNEISGSILHKLVRGGIVADDLALEVNRGTLVTRPLVTNARRVVVGAAVVVVVVVVVIGVLAQHGGGGGISIRVGHMGLGKFS